MVTQTSNRLDETLTFRLSTTEMEKLREVALREDRKPAAVARRFLLQALATESPRDGA